MRERERERERERSHLWSSYKLKLRESMESGIEASGCKEAKLIKLFYNQNDDEEEEEGRERERHWIVDKVSLSLGNKRRQ